LHISLLLNCVVRPVMEAVIRPANPAYILRLLQSYAI
jgi:hypothetical protein